MEKSRRNRSNSNFFTTSLGLEKGAKHSAVSFYLDRISSFFYLKEINQSFKDKILFSNKEIAFLNNDICSLNKDDNVDFKNIFKLHKICKVIDTIVFCDSLQKNTDLILKKGYSDLDLKKIVSLKELKDFANGFKKWCEANQNEFLKIEKLDLESKGLISIPDEIGLFKNLQQLNLKGNNLTSLSSKISKLENLKILGLEINELSTVPKSICKLKNLNEIKLSFNPLVSLPEILKFQNVKIYVDQKKSIFLKDKGFKTYVKQTYNDWINYYVKHDDLTGANAVLEQMMREGVKPNQVTYNALMNLYKRKGDLTDVKAMLEKMMREGVQPNQLTNNALMNLYEKVNNQVTFINLVKVYYNEEMDEEAEEPSSSDKIMTESSEEEISEEEAMKKKNTNECILM